MRFPYYEDLKIAHLFDTMYIEKNVIETLWRIIDGETDKEKIIKICSDIEGAHHAIQSVIWSNSNGYQNKFPWLLIEKQSYDVKEVIQRIKFPIGFSSNIYNILLKKGEFGGVKTHDWHTFIKVIILVWTYLYIDYIHLLRICFVYLWNK